MIVDAQVVVSQLLTLDFFLRLILWGLLCDLCSNSSGVSSFRVSCRAHFE